jgi:hypothetical protein
LTKLNLKPEHTEKLKTLTNAKEGKRYEFLGFALDLETSYLRDLLSKDARITEWQIQMISVLLQHYSQATQTPKTGNLTKFTDLPGGYAYERAFNQRAIQPIAQAFGDKPAELIEAAQLLGGKPLGYGDASAEISALEGLPIVYIVWGAHEFPASASILYDSSASSYLPTEDLAVLGELATARLVDAKTSLKTKKK